MHTVKIGLLCLTSLFLISGCAKKQVTQTTEAYYTPRIISDHSSSQSSDMTIQQIPDNRPSPSVNSPRAATYTPVIR